MKFHAFIRDEHEKSFISLRPGVQILMVNVVSTVLFQESQELGSRREKVYFGQVLLVFRVTCSILSSCTLMLSFENRLQ